MKIRLKYQGFTLIELMIVIAIIAIIAAFAIPAYSDYVTRAKRADAKTAISQVQLAEEQWRANNTSYTNDMTNFGYPGADNQASPDGYYSITITGSNPTEYIITATPVGSQLANDSECGSFIIDQDSTQSVTGSASGDPSVCWGK